MNINKLKIKSLLLFVSLLAVGNLYAQDRNVAWVHGLGENGVTWNIYHNMFDTEREINGTSRNYTDQSGVATMATTVRNGAIIDFPGSFGTGTDNIAIGHSLGGLAIRELDRTNTNGARRFGGIITTGSPNNGAAIIDNIRNGTVANTMNDACTKLLAGPLSEVPFVGVLVSGIAPGFICDALEDEFLTPLLGAQATGPSLDDVVVGGPFLNTLNANSPNVPAISIRGNENSPVHWRVLSSLSNNNTDDEEFVEVANLMRGIYNGFFIYHTSAAVVGGIFGFFNPFAWIAAAIHIYKAIQWNRGKKWFDQSESIWNGLIACTGTSQSVTTTVTTQIVDCNCFGYTGSPAWVQCLYDYCGGTINGCWQTNTVTYNITVNNTSDGLFCDQTQLIDGLASGNTYEAKGVNHNEEINTTNGTTDAGNDEVRDNFREIFDRTDVFGIPPR